MPSIKKEVKLKHEGKTFGLLLTSLCTKPLPFLIKKEINNNKEGVKNVGKYKSTYYYLLKCSFVW